MKINQIHKILLFCIAALLPCGLFAQETIVFGQVFDMQKQPLERVSVRFKNSEIATQSNAEGYFLLRTMGDENTVEFSSLGYKKQYFKIKRGHYAALEIVLEEEITWLPEVFVLPGDNPALDLMRKARLYREKNNFTRQKTQTLQGKKNEKVFLTSITNNRLIDKYLQAGNLLDNNDSSMFVPLLSAQEKFLLNGHLKSQNERELLNTEATVDNFSQQLLQIFDDNIDFYQNSITLFGKNFISPLANVSNSYYKFYLADSINNYQSKQYEIHFRSKNKKNLAFNGKLWLDSATFALTKIETELPAQANLNFVHHLIINQTFKPTNTGLWHKENEHLSAKLNYRFFNDTARANSQLLIAQNTFFSLTNHHDGFDNQCLIYSEDSCFRRNDEFKKNDSGFSEKQISEKMKALQETSLYKSALYIADILLTSNAQVGFFDIGNVKNILRVTEKEGWRLAAPLQTNEHLWKNLQIGGNLAYGFGNKKIQYSAFVKAKLPTKHKRVFGVNFTDDNRRIDYDYNDFAFREDLFATDDENFISTVLSFIMAKKMNRRQEFSFSYFNEWQKNLETSLYFRSNKIFADTWLPLVKNGTDFQSLSQNSLIVVARFSAQSRSYEDHLQRIYRSTKFPVFYGIAETGNYIINNKSGYYAKLTGIVKQTLPFEFGEWNYLLRGDAVLGAVPYPILANPHGNETGGCNLFKFSLQNYFAQFADRSLQFHNELIFNGLIFNHIPLVQKLNLREMFSFKVAYGSLHHEKHAKIVDFPTYSTDFQDPYLEFGAGITNILHFFSLQFLIASPNATNPNTWQYKIAFYSLLKF